jgi:hypothetical protein
VEDANVADAVKAIHTKRKKIHGTE